jgi:hypothetical protein
MFQQFVANRLRREDARHVDVEDGIARSAANRRGEQDIGVSDERVGQS